MNIAALLAEKPHPIPPTARVCGPGFGCPAPSGRAENYGHAEALILDALSDSTSPLTTTALATLTGLSASGIRFTLRDLEKRGRVQLTMRGKTLFAEVA